MGSLLSAGVMPEALHWYDAPCPNGHLVRVHPADVRILVD